MHNISKMPMIWYSGSPKERVKSITIKTAVRQPVQSDNKKRIHIYLPLIVLGANDHLSFK